MIIQRFLLLFFSFCLFMSCSQQPHSLMQAEKSLVSRIDQIHNPFIPGYSADPSMIFFEGKYYVYTSIDPWGSFELAVWETADFEQWTLRRLNWPTIISCTSSGSDKGMVTAPSVVKVSDHTFYMYVNSGGEIWGGRSDHPLGPWYSLTPDHIPLIPNGKVPGLVNSGAECFMDEDGKAYLFWGSGINWKNGRCMAVRLGEDMASFIGDPVEVTPPNYLEAPFVFRHEDQYFMVYADGPCVDSSSKIRYALADAPLGPWREGGNSPLLITHPEQGITGPGHPAVFREEEQYFLLYNGIRESKGYSLLRQIYLSSLSVNAEGLSVDPITLPDKTTQPENSPRVIEYSSELSSDYPARAATDHLSGTLWAAADDDSSPYLVIDLGRMRKVQTLYLWFEYGLSVYQYLIEYSTDNQHWKEYADAYDSQERGAPRFHTKYVNARYFRITFSRAGITEKRPAIWEISFE